MDLKRLQSIICSNYNRGAFCSGNSTIMQLGAEKKESNGAVRRAVVPGRREGKGTGKTKLRKATNKRKSKAQEV